MSNSPTAFGVPQERKGLMSDLSNLDDVRKTKVIDKELMRLKVDIAALQEMRLANSGFMKEQHYTFFWQGKPQQETREYSEDLLSEITCYR